MNANAVSEHDDPPAPSRRWTKPRSVLSVMFGIVAVIGLLTSVVAVWAHSVLFNSDKVAGAVESALEEPEVTIAFATYLTDQVFAVADVEAAVEQVLPDQLDRLGPVIAGGARTIVQNRLEGVLANDTTRALIVAVVERSHEALMRLLEGDGLVDGITVVDGEVTVNVLPLVTRGLQAVQNIGLLDGVVIPELSADGDPAEQAAELEQAFARDLPDGFGQLVVYSSESLADGQEAVARAQQAVVTVKRAIVLIVAITVLAFAASILLAVRRRRAILALLLASSAAMIIARTIVRKIVEDAQTLVVEPGARAAIKATVTTLTEGLRTAVTLTVVVGLILAVVAYLGGSSSSARSIRGATGSARGSLRAAVDSHRDATAIIAFGGAVAVIAVAGFGVAQLVVALVLVVLGAWALWAPGRTEAAPPAA